MVSGTHESSGQALIEVTVAITAVLFIVSAAVALVLVVKKEMKHDFLTSHGPVQASQSDALSSITDKDIPSFNDETRFFPKQKVGQSLEQLQTEGWSEDKRLKVPNGLVILLSNGSKHMSLIGSRAGNLGVMY